MEYLKGGETSIATFVYWRASTKIKRILLLSVQKSCIKNPPSFGTYPKPPQNFGGNPLWKIHPQKAGVQYIYIHVFFLFSDPAVITQIPIWILSLDNRILKGGGVVIPLIFPKVPQESLRSSSFRSYLLALKNGRVIQQPAAEAQPCLWLWSFVFAPLWRLAICIFPPWKAQAICFFFEEAWFQKRFKQKKRRRAWLVKYNRFLTMYLFL